MNEPVAKENQSSEFDEVIDAPLVSGLIVIARRKRLVFGLPILVGICTVLMSLALPIYYKAKANILPPQQSQSSAASLMAQFSGIANAAGVSGLKNPNDLYIGMLKSRTILDKLVQRFDLRTVYEVKLLEDARSTLAQNTILTSGKDGLIDIEVVDREPKRAADIANAYVDELTSLTRVIAVTEASQRRLFFEQQLQLSKDKLAEAEALLKNALDTHGVVSVDSQSRAIVETVARLRAEIAAKEIELGAMRPFVTENNQNYKRVQHELLSMRAELAKQENGGVATGGKQDQPKTQAGLDNIKILRDVKYYQMLYDMLSKQYEVARLDESKDSSIVQVLDRAIEPERKYKPRRALIVVIAVVLGFFFSILLAFALEMYEKTWQRPEGRRQLEIIKSHLRFR